MNSLAGLSPAAPQRPAPARRADAEAEALAWVPRTLLMGGVWRDAEGGRRLAVEDPATGRTLATVAGASPADCRPALDAAAAAHTGWAAATPRERSRVLRRAADGLRDAADTVALLLTLEMGKPLAESAAEVAFAA